MTSSNLSLPEGILKIVALGLAEYDRVATLQRRIVNRIKDGTYKRDYLIFVHHPRTITLGTSLRSVDNCPWRDDNDSQLSRCESLRPKVMMSNRGGKATAHYPGQLVCYPIINLAKYKKDVSWYLRTLERLIIETLASLGITAHTTCGSTGVYINGTRKIASIGVHLSRWISSHGFAINITKAGLEIFDYFTPCDFADENLPHSTKYRTTCVENELMLDSIAAHTAANANVQIRKLENLIVGNLTKILSELR